MASYPSKLLNSDQVYKLLSGTIIPRPIAWLTTKSKEGVVNAAPFSFFSIVSSRPPIVSIAFQDLKDTARNIIETGEAVIHLVNFDNLTDMNHTAAKLPQSLSELDVFKIEMTASETLDIPAIKNSQVRFETHLYQDLKVGEKAHLVLLEIDQFILDDQLLDPSNFHIDPDQLNPVARLAGNYYANLGETFELERPE